ncbi:hypothetical protein ABEB36_009706, partial [Hypothenemus hampei]
FSLFEKTQIITLIEERWSLNVVAERFGKSKSTIHRNLKKRREQQTTERSRDTGLQNKKTTNIQDNSIVTYQQEHPLK